MPSEPLLVRSSIKGFKRVDFEVKNIRKTLRAEASPIRKTARRLISSKRTSDPGDYAGRRTGLLKKAIKLKVARSGMSVAVAPFREGRMRDSKNGFYPAFLVYGRKDGSLKPRKNQMQEAFARHRQHAQDAIYNTVQRSIKART
ncbi:MAG: hypothetical protein ACSHWN_04715 [Methylophilaceae bacterium]